MENSMTSQVPYASGRTYYDADSHVMETLDWLTEHADPAIREILPPLHLGGAGHLAEKAIANAEARRSDPEATAALEERIIDGPKGWGALGASDATERTRTLDRLGFSLQLVFSTFAATQFLWHSDPKVLYGGARAHNRAISSFCTNDDRMLAVGIVPLNDASLAAQEVTEAIRLGCRAIWVPATPAGKLSPGHPDFDPIWAQLSEARVPMVLHIGGAKRLLPPAYFENGQPKSTDWLGGGENLRAKDFMAVQHSAELFLSTLIFDGVLMRFPELRCGAIELGAGWVPSWLDRMDSGARIFARSDDQLKALDLAPSEYVERQVRVTPFPFEDIGKLVRLTSSSIYLFSSDFPHPEGSRDPIGKFESTFGDADEATKRAFYSENFAELMRLEA
jgi:predicted TIM-barrel fold metal-dependent hydrolase